MGAHLVPMNVPEICCVTEPLNLKKLFLSANSAILIHPSVTKVAFSGMSRIWPILFLPNYTKFEQVC